MKDLRALLAAHGLRPSKGLGQHFLSDPNVLARIADAADLSPADRVIEIGPGPGTLTRLLAQRAGRVIAIELDARIIEALREAVAGFDNVALIQGDVLQIDIGELGRGEQSGYKVVGNLPYYITSAVLRHVLEAQPKPSRVVVTVQREVAERMTAKPGAMSLLSVSVQLFGLPQIVARIAPGSFFPPPRVESAIVRIDVYDQPRVKVEPVEEFFAVVRAGFSQKRKQLHNSLAHGLGLSAEAVVAALEAAGIDPKRRAETLAVEEWAELCRALAQRAQRDRLDSR